MDAKFWDQKYRESQRLFSGDPNGVLVAEAADLPPGHALDVGCGEGGDALWLARRGWEVTALDISEVALERAATAGADVGDRVEWIHGDLMTAHPVAGTYDLVSVQYFPLQRQPDDATPRLLLAAVAPGGTLLFGSHDMADVASHDPAFAPNDYYRTEDLSAFLDEDWRVVVNETRPRVAPAPAGTHHVNDTVFRAKRLR